MAVENDTRNKENTNLGQVPRKIDKSTLAQMTLDYIHHEVHDGKHFFWYDTVNIPTNTNYRYFYIQTANVVRLAHMAISFNANGYCQIDMGTCSQAGEEVVTTGFTNNRFPSANTSETKNSNGFITTAPTAFSAIPGLVKRLGRDGVTPALGIGAFGSDAGVREELILSPNTRYVVRAQALMDDVDVNIGINFYEHADKY